MIPFWFRMVCLKNKMTDRFSFKTTTASIKNGLKNMIETRADKLEANYI